MSEPATAEKIELDVENPVIAKTDLVIHDDSAIANLMDTARFNQMQRVATMLANSDLIPSHFRGKVANCFIALELASRLNVNAFMLMQNTYVVHGRPGFEAKLAVAVAMPYFKGPIQYRFEGSKELEYTEGNQKKTVKASGSSCTAYGILAANGERVEATVSWDMVIGEGWANPKPKWENGRQVGTTPSKWITMTDQMFCYRSAMFLIRRHVPGALMGMDIKEELEDTEAVELSPRDDGSYGIQPDSKTASLREKLQQKAAETQPQPGAPTEEEEAGASSDPWEAKRAEWWNLRKPGLKPYEEEHRQEIMEEWPVPLIHEFSDKWGNLYGETYEDFLKGLTENKGSGATISNQGDESAVQGDDHAATATPESQGTKNGDTENPPFGGFDPKWIKKSMESAGVNYETVEAYWRDTYEGITETEINDLWKSLDKGEQFKKTLAEVREWAKE